MSKVKTINELTLEILKKIEDLKKEEPSEERVFKTLLLNQKLKELSKLEDVN